MRRGAVLLVGLLIAVIALAAFPAQAGGYCYRVRILSKGIEIIDEWLGLGCSKSGQAVSVTRERVGDTLVETSRYIGR